MNLNSVVNFCHVLRALNCNEMLSINGGSHFTDGEKLGEKIGEALVKAAEIVGLALLL